MERETVLHASRQLLFFEWNSTVETFPIISDENQINERRAEIASNKKKEERETVREKNVNIVIRYFRVKL